MRGEESTYSDDACVELTKPNHPGPEKGKFDEPVPFLFFPSSFACRESDPFRRRHVGVDREMCRTGTVLYVGDGVV